MQICSEIRKKFHKRPNEIKLTDFELEWETGNKKEKPKTTEEDINVAAALSKARWGARLKGFVVTKNERN